MKQKGKRVIVRQRSQENSLSRSWGSVGILMKIAFVLSLKSLSSL